MMFVWTRGSGERERNTLYGERGRVPYAWDGLLEISPYVPYEKSTPWRLRVSIHVKCAVGCNKSVVWGGSDNPYKDTRSLCMAVLQFSDDNNVPWSELFRQAGDMPHNSRKRGRVAED